MKIDGIKVCFLLKSRTNVLGLEKFSFTRVQQIFSISFRPMPVGTIFSTVGWNRRGQKKQYETIRSTFRKSEGTVNIGGYNRNNKKNDSFYRKIFRPAPFTPLIVHSFPNAIV